MQFTSWGFSWPKQNRELPCRVLLPCRNHRGPVRTEKMQIRLLKLMRVLKSSSDLPESWCFNRWFRRVVDVAVMSNSRCLVAFDGLGRHDGMIKSWLKHRWINYWAIIGQHAPRYHAQDRNLPGDAVSSPGPVSIPATWHGNCPAFFRPWFQHWRPEL